MTKEEIQALYKTYIIPESKAPYRFFIPESYERDILAYNPLCGDKYHLYQSILNASAQFQFHGIGCALSQASCSLLARAAERKTIQEIKTLTSSFLQSLDLKNEIAPELPEGVKVLASLKHFEGRIECIRLPWQALHDELNR